MRITNLLVASPLVLVLPSVACGERMPQPHADEGISSGFDSGISGTGDTGDAGGAGAGYDSGGPAKLDAATDETGMADAGDAIEEIGCQRVDLLFVIDNSGSMRDEQVNLAAGVPGFIEAMKNQLADVDGYHVGVITTDDYEYNQSCPEVEGALVIATGGDDSSEKVCGPYADGHTFMTENDDLDTAFACAALVGTDGGSDERPMQTMKAALSEEMNGPGGCNEGFLRDDALLVVVIITDEEDDHEVDGCNQDAYPGSKGEPAEWFEDLVAAKGGVEENIVVLALVGPPGPDPEACPMLDKCAGGADGAEPAERIAEFTTMFTNGVVGRVCEDSFGDFFSVAVGVISSACDNFVPIG
jgi:hypothetical protein